MTSLLSSGDYRKERKCIGWKFRWIGLRDDGAGELIFGEMVSACIQRCDI